MDRYTTLHNYNDERKEVNEMKDTLTWVPTAREAANRLASKLWFILQYDAGELTKREAIQEYLRGRLCKACGQGLTVGDVYDWAHFAYAEVRDKDKVREDLKELREITDNLVDGDVYVIQEDNNDE